MVPVTEVGNSVWHGGSQLRRKREIVNLIFAVYILRLEHVLVHIAANSIFMSELWPVLVLAGSARLIGGRLGGEPVGSL
jgi:hypothetical protein